VGVQCGPYPIRDLAVGITAVRARKLFMTEEATEPIYGYLTTTGRVTGRAHRIEIWFVRAEATAYILNHAGRSNWVKNVRLNPQVTLEIGNKTFAATARRPLSTAEDRLARRLLYDKYAATEKGLADFTNASSTVVVAFDLLGLSGS